MRGKDAETFAVADLLGITPAYAGKSVTGVKISETSTDHPRLCGEKHDFHRVGISGLGSPPPMRGKEPFSSSTSVISGITPAYAGKRKIRQIAVSKCRDHPRLCGEKSNSLKKSKIGLGSPPPMRGKEMRLSSGTLYRRITPAYAGKRYCKVVFQTVSRDHPRLCGEKKHHASIAFSL